MNLKRVSVLLIFLFVSSLILSAEEKEFIGDWSGSISLQGMELAVNLHLTQDSTGTLAGTVDIPMQQSFGIKVVGAKTENKRIEFDISDIPGNPHFDGALIDNDSISGVFSQSGKEFPFYLIKKDDLSLNTDNQIVDEISAFVDSMLTVWNVPGASVAVTKNGKVLMSKGFGYKDIVKKEEVTSKTLFAIGSSTKAFTAADVATLVDKGTVKWNDKVKTHLMDFELSDSYVTEHAQILYLLCHRTGLPRHDFMWYGSNYTREDIYSKLKYMPLSKELREDFQYQNHMFMTLGVLIERVSGEKWENYTKNNILIPLKMDGTKFYLNEIKESGDYSLPYKEMDGKTVEVPFRDFPAMGPAGTINSNSDDMAKWVMFQCGDGKIGDNEVISKSSMNMMHSPQIIAGKSITSPEKKYTMYGLGWFIDSYRDINIIHHGGNIDGFTALAVAVPDSQWGIVVLTNKDSTPMPTIIMYYILDKLSAKEPVDWSERTKSRMESADKAEKESNKNTEKLPATKPTHMLKEYDGNYEHPAYGIMNVKYEKGRLCAYFNGFTMPLKHSIYDVFDAEFEGMSGAVMKVKFELNMKGDIDKLKIQLEPAVDEIEFIKKADDALTSLEYLKKYEGEFALENFKVNIELRGGSLIMNIPGQTPVQMEPSKNNEFNLKGMSGYFVKFDKNSKDFTLIQPNGSFLIKRVK